MYTYNPDLFLKLKKGNKIFLRTKKFNRKMLTQSKKKKKINHHSNMTFQKLTASIESKKEKHSVSKKAQERNGQIIGGDS